MRLNPTAGAMCSSGLFQREALAHLAEEMRREAVMGRELTQVISPCRTALQVTARSYDRVAAAGSQVRKCQQGNSAVRCQLRAAVPQVGMSQFSFLFYRLHFLRRLTPQQH